MDNTDNQHVERLKFFRNSTGLTQQEFADSINIARNSYSKIESGKGGMSYKTLLKLIDVYDVNPLWIMKGWGPMLINPSWRDRPAIPITYEEGITTRTRIEEESETYSVENRLKNLEEVISEWKDVIEEFIKEKKEKNQSDENS
jgi:transcriptional regulator with XRE-family HTH domain